MTAPDQYASVRYLVDDVAAAVDFYTTHLGFTLNTNAAPAFADVIRGPLRLLLSGPASSGARATPDDAATARPQPHPPRRRPTSTPRSPGSATRTCPSAATWSPAPADARSCSPTPPATSSNCSNQPTRPRPPHRHTPTRTAKPKMQRGAGGAGNPRSTLVVLGWVGVLL